MLGRLNRGLKEDAKNARPDQKLFAELQEFYNKHPVATHDVRAHVNKIRKECDEATDAAQKEFEEKHMAITCEFIKKELDFVKQFIV